MTDKETYVVTFDPRPVAGPGAIAGLKRMTLTEARKLRAFAMPTMVGRVVNATTLDTVEV